ncbi:MAG: tetratricopeptide repeat protein [Pseudomonadota bacterium]
MRVLVLGLGALAAVALAAPQTAEAQRGQTRERIEALEKQLRDLQGVVYGEEGATAPVRFEGANPQPQTEAQTLGLETGGGLPPEVSLRLSGLEQEVQRMTARMEELSYAMQLQQQRMDRLVQLVYPNYDEQVALGLTGQKQLLGDRAYSQPEPLEPPSGGPVDLAGGGSVASGALPEYGNSAAAYAAGRSALFSGRFEEAERAFLALTESYPDSEEYADGLYYLGETYLAQGDLRASAEAYLDFIRNHGDHPNAARAHLKLGEAFGKAGRTKEACRVWLRGVQTYPQMDPDLLEQIQQQQIEGECPGAPEPE